ncbi:MAG: hypothetical protein ACSLE6_13670 [Mycobacterium sp.]
MIAGLRAFGAFWYGFVIGDDWRVALGVTSTLAITYAISHTTSAPTWPLMIIAVVVLLGASIRRAIRPRRR